MIFWIHLYQLYHLCISGCLLDFALFMFWLRFIHVHSHFEPTHIQLHLDCAGFDGTVQLTVAPFDDGRLVWSHSHHSPPISCTRERVCDVKFQKQSKRNRDVIIQMRQTFRTGCFALRVFLFVLPTSQPGLLVSAYSSGSEQKARNLLPGHFLGALGSAWIHILAGRRHPETLVGRNTTFLPATVLSCFSTFNPNSVLSWDTTEWNKKQLETVDFFQVLKSVKASNLRGNSLAVDSPVA